MAKYGRAPDFGGSGRRYWGEEQPAALRLFFPHGDVPPADLRATLRTFVPEPPPPEVQGRDELPTRVRRPQVELGRDSLEPDPEGVELRVRETARAALRDVRALPRLVEAGEVRG